jgi:hypothetical protein
MISDKSDDLKARAEAAFRAVALQEKDNAMADYPASHQAEADKTARLRALRLAREAKKGKAKR